jgi:hypothetical protein
VGVDVCLLLAQPVNGAYTMSWSRLKQRSKAAKKGWRTRRENEKLQNWALRRLEQLNARLELENAEMRGQPVRKMEHQ